MRTTLTLDDDIVAKLREQTRKTGKPFKVVVNEVIRQGLTQNSQLQGREMPPFYVKARNLGLKKGMSYDNVSELLEQGEGAHYK